MSPRVAGLVMIGRFVKHEKLDQKNEKKSMSMAFRSHFGGD